MNKGIVLILIIALMIVITTGCAGSEEDTPANVLKNEEFSVTVPEDWAERIHTEITEERIRIYQKAAYESFGGGHLCTISKVPDHTVYPSYELLGVDEASGMFYIAEYPSDVQADVLNSESMAEYFEMFGQLPEIVITFALL